ncbi:MAG: DUF4350 domain-containing protein [Desulfuromonadales bacterium]|nr:DUF4350 domain-containing protein [Desulfuromonadales bacterium]
MRRCGLFVMILMLICTLAQAQPVVLFDEGHGQRFLPGQSGPLHLSGLADVLREAGFRVQSTPAPLSHTLLRNVDLLVISGAFTPLQPHEIDAVQAFVASGGGLAVMLHIAPPLAGLLHRLEVDFTNGTLREENHVLGGNPLDFRVTDLAEQPLFVGLDGFAVYGSWALRGTVPRVAELARTSARSWVDLNRNDRLDNGDGQQPFAVLVGGSLGDGRFAVFGDDALFQNRYLDQDNRQLAINLARWLWYGRNPDL